MSESTVNFWNEKDEYVGEKPEYRRDFQKDININIYCCDGGKIYIRETHDGIKINLKCHDRQDCCSCYDSSGE